MLDGDAEKTKHLCLHYTRTQVLSPNYIEKQIKTTTKKYKTNLKT